MMIMMLLKVNEIYIEADVVREGDFVLEMLIFI